MDDRILHSRLSRISTIWTLVGDAQRPTADAASKAQLALIQHYQGAVYRYLLGAVHDADIADELFQEFALRVLQGAFRHAEPGRGRFRDYLKTALVHLVIDYRNRQRRRPLALDPAVAEVAAEEDLTVGDEQFFRSWREGLLAGAWACLEQAECRGEQPYYSVLRFRAENPEASSAEMAARAHRAASPRCPVYRSRRAQGPATRPATVRRRPGR